MNLLQRQGFYNSLILYAGTALGFVNLIILFKKILSLEEIGFFMLMGTISLIYAQVASLGISNIIFKYFPHYRTDDKKHGGFVAFVVIWCGLSFLLFTIVFLLFKNTIISHYYGKNGSTLLVKYFYLLMPMAFLTMVYTVIESMAITVFKNVLSSFLREVVLRLFTAAGVLLIASSLTSYHGFLMLYLAANIFIILVLWAYLYRSNDFKLAAISSKVLSQRKQFFKYGAFTLLSSTSFALIQSLDNIMLSIITTDLKIVAIYSIFFAIAVVISLPAKALSRTSLQIIAQAWAVNDLPKIGKIYHKTSVMQMLLGCVLFICLVVNKQFIIMLLDSHKDGVKYTGPDYAGYFGVFIVVGLGFLADITGGVNGYIINLSRYYKLTTYFIVSSVVFCAVINWILIPKIGMMGAAIAYFLTMFMLNFMYWLYVKVKFGLQPFDKTHLLILFISAVTLLAGWYLPVIANPWFDMLLRSAAVILIYAGFTYFLKISEDLNMVFDKLFSKK